MEEAGAMKGPDSVQYSINLNRDHGIAGNKTSSARYGAVASKILR
jgi:hypothetical protein